MINELFLYISLCKGSRKTACHLAYHSMSTCQKLREGREDHPASRSARSAGDTWIWIALWLGNWRCNWQRVQDRCFIFAFWLHRSNTSNTLIQLDVPWRLDMFGCSMICIDMYNMQFLEFLRHFSMLSWTRLAVLPRPTNRTTITTTPPTSSDTRSNRSKVTECQCGFTARSSVWSVRTLGSPFQLHGKALYPGKIWQRTRMNKYKFK